MAIEGWYANLTFFLRWMHILFGIIWIGHLYFFNFVNVPFQAGLAKEVKPQVNPALLGRALWWFRWGAMMTWLIGIALLLVKYTEGGLWTEASTGTMSHRAMWILWGGLLGTIMWFNVWFIIWPAQKQLLGWMKAGQAPPPEAANLAPRALKASRINVFLSGPMLFAMIAPNNYGSINAVTLLVTIAVGLLFIWGFIRMSYKVGQDI